MDGASHVHGPLRPVPLHCQGSPSLDPMFFPPSVPLPAMGLDLRLPPKPPFHTVFDSFVHTTPEKVIPFQTDSQKGTPPHGAVLKGALFHPIPEMDGVFCVASEKGPLIHTEKANPFHLSCSKIFHSVSDKTTPFCTSTSKLSGMLAPFPTLPHPLTLFQQLRRHHHSLVMSERLVPEVILPDKSSLILPMRSPPLPANTTVMQSVLSGCGFERTRRELGEDTFTVSGFSPTTISESSSSSATSPYGRKVFPCPQCRYATDRRNNLKRHMLTMHQLSAKLLECCGVLFRTKAALREHALVFHYHGYSCFYCGRRFCRKALLKRHLTVHSGQKEFLCNVCDYATSHKSNLERHRRVHIRQDMDENLASRRDGSDERSRHDRVSSVCDDVKSNVSERDCLVDCVSFDDLSSEDEEEEEINVHGD